MKFQDEWPETAKHIRAMQLELAAAKADAKHCEELCMEACRHLVQFRPDVSQAITVRIKRVVNGHCEVPKGATDDVVLPEVDPEYFM